MHNGGRLSFFLAKIDPFSKHTMHAALSEVFKQYASRQGSRVVVFGIVVLVCRYMQNEYVQSLLNARWKLTSWLNAIPPDLSRIILANVGQHYDCDLVTAPYAIYANTDLMKYPGYLYVTHSGYLHGRIARSNVVRFIGSALDDYPDIPMPSAIFINEGDEGTEYHLIYSIRGFIIAHSAIRNGELTTQYRGGRRGGRYTTRLPYSRGVCTPARMRRIFADHTNVL